MNIFILINNGINLTIIIPVGDYRVLIYLDILFDSIFLVLVLQFVQYLIYIFHTNSELNLYIYELNETI